MNRLGAGISVLIASATFVAGCQESKDPARESNPNFIRVTEFLPQAQLEPANAPIHVGHPEIGFRTRRAIVVSSSSRIVFPHIRVDHPFLRMSLGARRTGDPGVRTSAEFQVFIRTNEGSEESLLHRNRKMPKRVPYLMWEDVEIDLRAYRGKKVELEFTTRIPQSDLDVYWASPVLYGKESEPGRPNVILISLDTLGTKHMSLYGYDRSTTPKLERFAQDAVTFDQAITHQSWTLTAHASLLTSLYPDTHRVAQGTSLPEEAPLLPKILTANGYYSFGLVNNPYLNPSYGYQAGYDHYDFHHFRIKNGEQRNRGIEESNAILAPHLSKPHPSPFFLFYHLIDAHSDWRDSPYESPAPFSRRFSHPELSDVSLVTDGAKASRLLAQVNQGKIQLGPDQLQVFEALYDGGVAYLDHHLGGFFDQLRQEGLYDESLIIVTSDHGEEFLEHGKTMHTQGYDETLRVPLIIKFPGNRFAGQRVASQVYHVDVVPTILDIIGVGKPEALEGDSLVDVIQGAPHPRPIGISKGENFSMTQKDVYVARSEKWKLIWQIDSDRTELYNLATDPAEQHDVDDAHPEMRRELLEVLREHRRARDEGFRVRIPSFPGNELLIIRLSSDAPIMQTNFYSQGGKPLPEDALRLSADQLSLSLQIDPTIRERWRPVGIDFDLAPTATLVVVEIQVGEKMLEAGDLLLGPNHLSADSMPFRTSPHSPSIQKGSATRVDFPTDTKAPRAYLWEARSSRDASVHLSEDEKSTLRALGYIVE